MNSFEGALTRNLLERQHEGAPCRVVAMSLSLAAPLAALQGAIRSKSEIAQWFTEVEGDFELGGRFDIKDNANGTILACSDEAWLMTWEVFGTTSWLRLEFSENEGRSTLTLEHIHPKASGSEDHWKMFGPGATGLGWGMALMGLHHHLDPALDASMLAQWWASDAGKDYLRISTEKWGLAHQEFGESEDAAQAAAKATADFYRGA